MRKNIEKLRMEAIESAQNLEMAKKIIVSFRNVCQANSYSRIAFVLGSHVNHMFCLLPALSCNGSGFSLKLLIRLISRYSASTATHTENQKRFSLRVVKYIGNPSNIKISVLSLNMCAFPYMCTIFGEWTVAHGLGWETLFLPKNEILHSRSG